MSRIASVEDVDAVHRSIRPLSDRAISTLTELQHQVFAEAERNSHLGWRPAAGETAKDGIRLTAAQFRWFASHLFGGIGFELSHDFRAAGKAVPEIGTPLRIAVREIGKVKREAAESFAQEAAEIRRFAPALEPQWCALLRESADIGGLSVPARGPAVTFPLSLHALRVSSRAPHLLASLDRPPSRLLEIGGGHGRFVRDCALMMPDCRLVLTDLPFNLLISARYLAEYFGRDVNLCLLPHQSFDPDARINLVAPWRLDEIGVVVDTACNFLSFQHMDDTNLRWYGDAMRRLGVERLFQINRNGVRDPHDMAMDDYPFASEFEPITRRTIRRSKVYTSHDWRVVRHIDIVLQLSRRHG